MQHARSVAIHRLVVSDFRSYPAVEIAVDGQIVVVTGENGSGKTNLLEAISLFAQGRGFRRADLRDCARRGGSGGFAISVDLVTDDGTLRLGAGLEPPDAGGMAVRRYRIDREPVDSGRSFADHMRLVWLTPAMDSLFSGSPSDRRRFLDRLVLAVDAEHGTRVNALERALRQRNKVLEDGPRADGAWLDAIEREVAELAVAVAAARSETIARLRGLIDADHETPFPWAEVALAGDLEAFSAVHPALEVEDHYRTMLKGNRRQDAAAGRTLIGPHTSDLAVRHGPKAMEAAFCSTGEQKALLVGLILAHAKLVADFTHLAPIVLLDEIAAHFDAARRAALFDALARLKSQVWMTGADEAAFSAIGANAQRLRVLPGHVMSA